MEAAQSHFMTPFSRPTLVHRLTASSFKRFCSAATTTTQLPPPAIVSELLVCKPPKKLKVTKVLLQAQNKENWLESLSCPFPTVATDAGSDWVIGVDPDASGALALLKPDHSAQVFDSPHLKILVGGRMRKRLDTKSIVRLLQSLDAPVGTTAYIEQSTPFPKDGKQGWWSGGFGYGLWIGVLVASGFRVVPVSSALWKNQFKLSGRTSTKDDSRELAISMFPSVSSLLKRKKDHGRAEALLIAAYGRGVNMEFNATSLSEAQY